MFDTPKTGNVEDIFSGTGGDAARSASASPSPPVSPLPPAAAVESGMPQPPAPPPMLEAGTSSGKRFILALAVILLIALAGGAAYWYFRVSRITRPALPDIRQGGDLHENAAVTETIDPVRELQPTDPQPIAPESEVEPIPAFEPASEPVPVAPRDSDGDGLSDVEEAAYGTDSNIVDTDGDGLFDYEEIKVYGTSPVNADSDGDGFSDGVEVRNGYNPNGPGTSQKVPGQ